jgi:hypothetical protein
MGLDFGQFIGRKEATATSKRRGPSKRSGQISIWTASSGNSAENREFFYPIARLVGDRSKSFDPPAGC